MIRRGEEDEESGAKTAERSGRKAQASPQEQPW